MALGRTRWASHPSSSLLLSCSYLTTFSPFLPTWASKQRVPAEKLSIFQYTVVGKLIAIYTSPLPIPLYNPLLSPFGLPPLPKIKPKAPYTFHSTVANFNTKSWRKRHWGIATVLLLPWRVKIDWRRYSYPVWEGAEAWQIKVFLIIYHHLGLKHKNETKEKGLLPRYKSAQSLFKNAKMNEPPNEQLMVKKIRLGKISHFFYATFLPTYPYLKTHI